MQRIGRIVRRISTEQRDGVLKERIVHVPPDQADEEAYRNTVRAYLEPNANLAKLLRSLRKFPVRYTNHMSLAAIAALQPKEIETYQVVCAERSGLF